jgi:hypothetical protein
MVVLSAEAADRVKAGAAGNREGAAVLSAETSGKLSEQVHPLG